LVKVFKHEVGVTAKVEAVDPAWLRPGSGIVVWVVMDNPTPEEAKILSDVFHIHELAIEDALAEIHFPKIESYGDYLYLVLHGIDFHARHHTFKTKDVDFFVAPQFLITIHHGVSRSIAKVEQVCERNSQLLADGTAALLHRLIDALVDNYRPEIEKLQERLDKIETEVWSGSGPAIFLDQAPQGPVETYTWNNFFRGSTTEGAVYARVLKPVEEKPLFQTRRRYCKYRDTITPVRV